MSNFGNFLKEFEKNLPVETNYEKLFPLAYDWITMTNASIIEALDLFYKKFKENIHYKFSSEEKTKIGILYAILLVNLKEIMKTKEYQECPIKQFVDLDFNYTTNKYNLFMSYIKDIPKMDDFVNWLYEINRGVKKQLDPALLTFHKYESHYEEINYRALIEEEERIMRSEEEYEEEEEEYKDEDEVAQA